MPFIHYSSNEINCKVVYFGPGLCGKTANIRYIYNNTNPESKGKLVSIATDTDHTLFFDFLPIYLGSLNDLNLKFHLYTVPGQIFYKASRKLILRGVDGIVFVADSQVERMDANIESMEDLKKNLSEQEIDLNLIPLIIQYNKRDLSNIMPVDEMNRLLNPRGLPVFEATAIKGDGVFESLKEVTKQVISEVKQAI